MRTAAWYKEDGAVAIANDADTFCIDCAIKLYGDRTEDFEGNILQPLYHGDHDLHGQYCMGDCYQLLREGKRDEYDNRLCGKGCECYRPCGVPGYRTNYDFYNEFGHFPDYEDDECFDDEIGD